MRARHGGRASAAAARPAADPLRQQQCAGVVEGGPAARPTVAAAMCGRDSGGGDRGADESVFGSPSFAQRHPMAGGLQEAVRETVLAAPGLGSVQSATAATLNGAPSYFAPMLPIAPPGV